jgi:hypothetical protein
VEALAQKQPLDLLDSEFSRGFFSRQLRTPSLLISCIVRACPHVTALECEAFDTEEDNFGRPPRDHALSSLLASPPSLTYLKYNIDDIVDGQQCHLVELLQVSPQLKTLVVSDEYLRKPRIGLDNTLYRDLFEAVASLAEVENLTIGIPLPSFLDELFFRSPSKRLSLNTNKVAVPPSLYTFLNTFSATLIALDLLVPAMPTPLSASSLHLPHLQRLTLFHHKVIEDDRDDNYNDATPFPFSTPSPYSFFSSSPLQTLRINACDEPCIPIILSFVDEKKDTLKSVTIGDSKVSERDLQKVGEQCKNFGIRYDRLKVGWSTTESEEEEEEEEEDYHDDRYYNAYGYSDSSWRMHDDYEFDGW